MLGLPTFYDTLKSFSFRKSRPHKQFTVTRWSRVERDIAVWLSILLEFSSDKVNCRSEVDRTLK
jgi:hypothetical protein